MKSGLHFSNPLARRVGSCSRARPALCCCPPCERCAQSAQRGLIEPYVHIGSGRGSGLNSTAWAGAHAKFNNRQVPLRVHAALARVAAALTHTPTYKNSTQLSGRARYGLWRRPASDCSAAYAQAPTRTATSETAHLHIFLPCTTHKSTAMVSFAARAKTTRSLLCTPTAVNGAHEQGHAELGEEFS